MSEKEETDMGDIKKNKINILPNLSITDKMDNIKLNTNNEKRMSKIKEKINNFEIVDYEINVKILLFLMVKSIEAIVDIIIIIIKEK